MPNKAKTRYAVVGLGSRSSIFWKAAATDFKSIAQLVGFCDTNQTRMNLANHVLKEECGFTKPVPTFRAGEFDAMIKKTRPDCVIVTTIDRTHHEYIARAMDLGCDVITEKPMTTDMEKCRVILDAIERTGRSLRVAFNYRYSPPRSKVKELIRAGTIGEVKAVHFEWMLNTEHGADYFRRWHRDKRNSGGLMVHKSTHHFDLVNWWLDSKPELVFGMGALSFYGKENAEKRGVTEFYYRGTGRTVGKDDPFALDLQSHPRIKALYLDAEHEDGYLRDQSVFGDGINIEDTMNVLVRYQNKAQLSYTLVAYAPWEGYRAMFSGTKGRIELMDTERSYISGKSDVMGESTRKDKQIMVYPHFAEAYEVVPPKPIGGHGGGDVPMLEEIFKGPRKDDPLRHAASHIDGMWSILPGIAANQSFATGLPVRIGDLQ